MLFVTINFAQLYIYSCATGANEIPDKVFPTEVSHNLFLDTTVLKRKEVKKNKRNRLDIFNHHGMKIFSDQRDAVEILLMGKNFSPEIFYFRISSEEGAVAQGKRMVL
jgi:hypothetical protein